ncbi:TIGR01777 family oxidoreductase [Paenibacillus sp. MWE-103]|uniref:TIGR01777 family oxidoreductase n=1 Tax=Paenibacillus artemisiicola TaxID=1172618 RepID=A0ABS3WHI1_9BACL|nr:TIGR01777 family oxidoreductase [Paenibacillus artemisiicola]MBO7747758.1 TIGR01777 family oxidoreductase [Paenibacillus artemisiicola]
MKVAVAGGTGYVGRLLVAALKARGDEVALISRSGGGAASASGPRRITWAQLAASPEVLEGFDAIVNLAGETISRRWNKSGKQAILQSRLDAVDALAKAAAALKRKPGVVVNASGISVYGTDGSVPHDENSAARGTDFLASVVGQWEAAADRIPVPRLVKLRIGLVIGLDDGAFPKMLLPYRLFAGGRIGSGKQWMPWIHEEDMVRLILFCLDRSDIEGPVNACAPEPLTNDEFGRAVGAAARKPHWLPLPSFVLKGALGEMSFLLLEGSRAIPRKATAHGFSFRYRTADAALGQLFGRQRS